MVKPAPVLAHEPTLLDRLDAGAISRAVFEDSVVDQVYAGLARYCQIPDGYRACALQTRLLDIDGLSDGDLRALLRTPPAEIINPAASHIKAVALFEMLLSGDPRACEHGDPLNPTVGAYLYGPPGTGKTHLMAAYGRKIEAILDEKLAHVRTLLRPEIKQGLDHYRQRVATEAETDDESTGYAELAEDGSGEITMGLSPADEFWALIERLQGRLRSFDFQPTDLIYIGFKELVELCLHSTGRHDAMRALEQARIVFIDDVHPQGDAEQVQIVLHLLERRYEMGRAGTFLTTNLRTEELGGGDEMLGRRLLSRCAETLVTIDFSDCDDWRRSVRSRRVALIEDALQPRIADHRHRDDGPESNVVTEP